MKKKDLEYDKNFGDIPDTQEERIKYILGDRENDQLVDTITIVAKRLKRIKKSVINFTMWTILRPSARPRVNLSMGYPHMYVPRAAENGKWFEKFFKENNLPYINTPCMINIQFFEKTPNSFNIKDKVLAEMGIIRPWKRTGDIDNYTKSVLDCIQHGLLEDDCLVIESTQKLFYSIKPHVNIEITYLNEFPNSKYERKPSRKIKRRRPKRRVKRSENKEKCMDKTSNE